MLFLYQLRKGGQKTFCHFEPPGRCSSEAKDAEHQKPQAPSRLGDLMDPVPVLKIEAFGRVGLFVPFGSDE